MKHSRVEGAVLKGRKLVRGWGSEQHTNDRKKQEISFRKALLLLGVGGARWRLPGGSSSVGRVEQEA